MLPEPTTGDGKTPNPGCGTLTHVRAPSSANRTSVPVGLSLGREPRAGLSAEVSARNREPCVGHVPYHQLGRSADLSAHHEESRSLSLTVPSI
jgi:hypothetical protein